MNLTDKVTGFFGPQGANPNATVAELLQAINYQTAEHSLGFKWIDGREVFRIVRPFVGGNGSSQSAANAELEGANRSTIISVDWAITRPAADSHFSGLTVVVDASDGSVSTDHQGLDLTGFTGHCIVVYTKP